MIESLPKISDLYLDFFERNRDNLPGASHVDSHNYPEMIRIGALDFIKSMCGDIYQDITDDENLNAEIIDTFAQTFVSHFWNNEIGYEDEFTFAVKLKAFFNEQLPLWAEYYKELIVLHGGYKNVEGEIKVNGNTASHSTTTAVNDLVNNTTNNAGKNSSNKSSSSTDTKQNTTETGDTTEDSKNNTTTSSTENGDRNNDNVVITRDNQLNASADTPQDELKFNKSVGNNVPGTFSVDDDQYDTDQFKPQNAYNFNYASKVEGNWEGTNTRNIAHDQNNLTKEDETNATGSKSTHSSSNTDAVGNTKQIGETDYNEESHSTVLQKTNGTNDTEGSQTGSNTNRTVYSQRTLPVGELARGLNKIANGAFLNVFIVAKRAGLFMLDYE